MKKYLIALAEDVYDRVIASYKSTLVSMALGALIEALAFTTDYLRALPDGWAHYLAGLCVLAGMALKSKAAVSSRMAKRAAAKLIVTVLFLGLATPAFAGDMFVHCFSGCPDRSGSKKAALMGAVDTQVSATVWIGPSLGLQPYVFDAETKLWNLEFRPTFGYGVKYRPAMWTATGALLAADLFVTGKFTDNSSLDLLPTITFLDALQVGFGPRFHFTTPESSARVTWLFAIGFGTAIGGP